MEEDRKETEDLLRQKGLISNEYNDEKKETGTAGGSEAVQITNDLYNRVKFMEMAAFFFGYAGLGMVIIEYELRYYFENGIFVEWVPEGDKPPDSPIGLNDFKRSRL